MTLTALVAVLALAVSAQAELVAFYEFEGDATDSSGNGLDGTVVGSLSFGAGLGGGQAMTNDGTADRYVSVPVHLGPGVANKLTVGCWVDLDDASTYQGIFSTNGHFARALKIDQRGLDENVIDGQFRYSAFGGFGENDRIFNSTTLDDKRTVIPGNVASADDGWVFLAVTYDNSRGITTLYNNDTIYQQTDSYLFGNWDSDETQVGATASQYEMLIGSIDNFFVFDNVLTPAQVATIRDAGNPLTAAQQVSDEQVATSGRKWKVDIGPLEAQEGASAAGMDKTAGNGLDEYNVAELVRYNTSSVNPSWTDFHTTKGAASTVGFRVVDSPAGLLDQMSDHNAPGALHGTGSPTIVFGYEHGDAGLSARTPVANDGILFHAGAGDSNNLDFEITGLEPGRAYLFQPATQINPGWGEVYACMDTDANGLIDQVTYCEDERGYMREFTVIADQNGIVKGRFTTRATTKRPDWGFSNPNMVGGFALEELPADIEVQPAPLHRYSFDGDGGNGSFLWDSIGDAHGQLLVNGANGSSLTGTGQMRLINVPSADTEAYGDLPNHLIGAGSGLTECTIELWFAPEETHDAVWVRAFSFGSSVGNDADANGEVTSFGTDFSGDDRLSWTAKRMRTDESWRTPHHELNARAAGLGASRGMSTTSWMDGQMIHLTCTFGHDFDGAPIVRFYQNGMLMAQLDINWELAMLNDVNNWLGRSQWGGDDGMPGVYDELRIYGYAMSHEQVINSFVLGPNVSFGGAADPVPVSEPAGLGLLGLAALAMRKRRA
jgi:MYXO-CTERM domain-containing protein